METMPYSFVSEMAKLGVISYSEQDTIWQIAKKCAKKHGMAVGAAGALMGMKAGSVTIPLGPIGGAITMSGAVAGFLAGLAGGTLACTVVMESQRKEIHKLIEATRGKPIK
ncbi:hypothetical protein [Hyunsoonleella rubra]|uniref:DUF5862 domain-containing protein n=1 Tax=Hyunsoonleella rubra TaxID=1737062 RepID=A0ABW5TEC6_9FLAO